MTITTTNDYSGPYLANGSTVDFPFTFTAPTAEEVKVVTRLGTAAPVLIDPVDYTVALAGGGGGTVTFVTAPATGNSVYVMLDPDFTQEIVFEDGTGWVAQPVNEEADRSVSRDQYLKGEVDRAVKVHVGDTPPRLGVRSTGQVLVIDQNGDIIGADSDVGSTAVVLSTAAQVAADAAEVEANTAIVAELTESMSDGLPVYADVTTGLAAVADGSQFRLTPAQGHLSPLFTRVDATNAQFEGWRAPTVAAQRVRNRITAMRARASRPAYEWFMGNHYDGRYVVNTGYQGDVSPEPHYGQWLGGAWCLFDGDGATNGTRIIWPSGVINDLGYAEVVTGGIDASTHDFLFVYKFDADDGPNPTVDLRVYADVRTALGATDEPVLLGVDGGTDVNFTTSGTFTLQTVDITGYQPGTDNSITLGPDTGAGPSYPITMYIQRAGITAAYVVPPTMAETRNFQLAGHAMPPFAFGNASLTDESFLPTAAVPNLLAPLTGDDVGSAHWTFYVDMDAAQFDGSEAYVASYGREDRNDADLYDEGGMLISGGTLGTDEYAGRMTPRIGGAPNQGVTTPCDTQMWGAGLLRVDVMVAGVGSESRQNNNQAVAGDQRWSVWINGIPQSEYPVDAFPADIAPRMLWLAGHTVNTSKAFVPLTGRNVRSPLKYVAYTPGIADIPEAADIWADIDFLGSTCGLRPEPTISHIAIEGDSTSRFSGNPHWYAAYLLRGEGRLFTNMSQGGSFYNTGSSSPATSQFNSDGRISWREDVADGTLVWGYPYNLGVSHGGENNTTHLADPAQALADYAALFPAETDAAGGRWAHAIVTVRPSGAGATAGRANKDAYNAYLRSVFTEQVDVGNDYLFRDPNYDGSGFEFMIDLDAWQPRHPDYGLSYTDWDDLLINDTGPSKSNKIISGDYQHWAGTDGGKYAAIDVFTPSYQLIFQTKWGVTL